MTTGGGEERHAASLSVEDEAGFLRLTVATDRGPQRRENQDAWALVELTGGGAALAVADGMGGHADGGVAAALAVEATADAVLGAAVQAPAAGAGARASLGGIGRGNDVGLIAAVSAATRAVLSRSVELGGELIGTTLVSAVVRGRHAVVANVGDSRAYLIRGGEARQLTDDHSWVGEQVRAGALPATALRTHPRRNIVARAITGEDVEPDLIAVELEDGDLLLLCSDGVWEPLSDEQIAAATTAGGPDSAALAAVDAALAAGADDNVTVAVCCRQAASQERRIGA